jgi:hypothetical protein
MVFFDNDFLSSGVIAMLNRKLGFMLGLCLLLSSIVWARGESLAGTWVATVDQSGSKHTFTFVFEVKENTFSGTVSLDDRESYPVTDGKIDGNKITFKAGPPNDLAYINGTISGDVLQMDLNDPDGKYQFSLIAKRKQSAEES